MQLKLRNFFPISFILFVSILSSYQKLSVVPEHPHHFIFFSPLISRSYHKSFSLQNWRWEGRPLQLSWEFALCFLFVYQETPAEIIDLEKSRISTLQCQFTA